MYEKLRAKMLEKVEQMAALKIQTFVRMSIQRKWWTETRERRRAAASMIQRNYRIFRSASIIPMLVKAKKNQAATICQKFTRGYMVWR